MSVGNFLNSLCLAVCYSQGSSFGKERFWKYENIWKNPFHILTLGSTRSCDKIFLTPSLWNCKTIVQRFSSHLLFCAVDIDVPDRQWFHHTSKLCIDIIFNSGRREHSEGKMLANWEAVARGSKSCSEFQFSMNIGRAHFNSEAGKQVKNVKQQRRLEQLAWRTGLLRSCFQLGFHSAFTFMPHRATFQQTYPIEAFPSVIPFFFLPISNTAWLSPALFPRKGPSDLAYIYIYIYMQECISMKPEMFIWTGTESLQRGGGSEVALFL